jgi:hypothetical protein
MHSVCILCAQVGALTMDLIDLEIKRTEHRAAEEGISPAMVAQKALDASTGQVQLQEREKKLLALIQKQDRLLYLCFYLLLNLAEDVGIEKKMKKKNGALHASDCGGHGVNIDGGGRGASTGVIMRMHACPSCAQSSCTS